MSGRTRFSIAWAASSAALATGVFLAWVGLGAWLATRASDASPTAAAAFAIYAWVILCKGLLPAVLLTVAGAGALEPRFASAGGLARAVACLGAALGASALACGWLLPLDLPTLPAVVYSDAANLLRTGLELAAGAAAASWVAGAVLARARRSRAETPSTPAPRAWRAGAALAGGTALLVAVALGPNPSPPRSLPSGAADGGPSGPAAPLASPSETVHPPAPAPAEPSGPATSALPVVVLRTEVEAPRSRSQAVLLHAEHRSVQTAYEGDRVLHHPEAALARIELDHVLVARDGLLERLPVGGSPSALARLFEGGQPAPETPEQRQAKRENARRVAARLEEARAGDGSPARVDRGGLLAAGEPVPVYRDGELEGLRLEALEPGGFYERIGLREGDVVTAVNGAALDEAGALTWLARTRPGGQVEVEVRRADGQDAAIRLPVDELMGELRRLTGEGAPPP